MKYLQSMARKSLKGDRDTHRVHSTKFKFIIIYITGSYHKRKKVLGEKCGKLRNSKPFNDDNGIVDNKQQKYIKQIAGASDEGRIKNEHMKQKMVYISIVMIFYSRHKGVSSRSYR